MHVGAELKAFLPLLFALLAAAWLAAVDGDPVRAIELYALASRYRFVSNSCWFEDVVGKYIQTTAKALPSDFVYAARKRGRALDLWEMAEACLQEWQSLALGPMVLE